MASAPSSARPQTRRGHGLSTPLVDATVRSRPARNGAVSGWAGLVGGLSRSSGRSALKARSIPKRRSFARCFMGDVVCWKLPPFFFAALLFPQFVPSPGPSAGLAATCDCSRCACRDSACGRGCSPAQSARTSCSAGSGPPPWHSPCSGSSNNHVAKARCAATERMPLQRCAGAAAARARASRRMNCAASRDQQPPTSTPKTTRRHRRALSSSGRCDGTCAGQLGRGLQQAGHLHRLVALWSCRPG